jgi:hypothetical protein
MAQQDAPLARQAQQLLAAQSKVVFPMPPQDAARMVPPAADHQARSSVDPPVTADEWVSVPAVGPQAQPASQLVEPR